MIRLLLVLLLILMNCSHSGALSVPRGAKILEIVVESRSLQGNNNKNNNKDPSSAPSAYQWPTESPYPSPSPSTAPTVSAQPSSAGVPAPPTFPPTMPPSTSFPTPSPTPFPSPSPSQFPSTSSPSLFPSSLPTMTGVVGYVNLTFSLLADGVTSKSVRLGQNQSLVSKIEDALLYTVCEDTDNILLDNDNTDICAEMGERQLRELQDNSLAVSQHAGESILRPDQSETAVKDRSEHGFLYTEWVVMYPVLHLGNTYKNMSDEDAVQAIQFDAQSALSVRLKDGDFDERIDNLGQASVVGHEHAIWTQPYFAPLQPAPLHHLRMAGIVLFLISFVATCLVTNLAKQRRIEREWDAEFKERGKGGLVTEEGLDFMLEAGRSQSMAQQKEVRNIAI